MGGHYGSVQVRSEDRERVKAVAEQVARDKGIHILVAPPVNGWIALFPERHGQDDEVGRAVAEQLDGDVLHLLVHDDDIFAYWLYRDRRLIDSYWSAPGYFGESDRELQEAMAGNPEAFRPLISDDVRRLPKLLDRDDTAIVHLALSADERTLGAVAVSTPSRERAAGSRVRRPALTVWSYSKLRGPFLRRGD